MPKETTQPFIPLVREAPAQDAVNRMSEALFKTISNAAEHGLVDPHHTDLAALAYTDTHTVAADTMIPDVTE